MNKTLNKSGHYVSEFRDNRIKNSARTTAVNVCLTLAVVFGPFILRTLMIYHFGDKYAGLNSFLISIISVLNMSELGLAEVVVFFLYEPMAIGYKDKTERYLNLLKRVYGYVGLFVISAGLLFTPFLRFLIKDELPNDVNLTGVYLLLLAATGLQYFIIPEVIVLANAVQRGDLSGLISLFSNLIAYIIQVLAIVVFHSFTLYFVAVLIQSILTAVFRMLLKHLFFSQYRLHGSIDAEEKALLKNRVLSLLGHQLDEKFISSVDYVILSAFMGLSVVTVYANYMYVVTALGMIMTAVFKSLTASLGNAFVTEEVESNHVRFRAVLWLNGIAVSWFITCMLCLYQPFMVLWMGNRLFSIDTVLLFCLYFFVTEIRKTVITFKNANGMWWEDRYKPYVSMVINLIVDIILVKYIGVNGALISSIICILFIEIPWEGNVLFKEYFGRKALEYFSSIRNYMIYSTVLAACMFFVCERLFTKSNLISLLLRGILCTLFFGVVSLIVFRKSDELRIWTESVKSLIYHNNRMKR